MNTFPSLQVCSICLDTDNKLCIINDSQLGTAYEALTGQSLCNGEDIRRYLCGDCVYILINFTRFRDKSLRAISVMEDLAGFYSVVTLEHIKLIDRHTCQLTSRLTRTAIKQDHCDLYIKHSDSDTQTDQEISDGVVVKNKQSQFSNNEDELIYIADIHTDKEQNCRTNATVKTEISENDEIDFDNFSVEHTLGLDKENDELRNIGKQTECETELNYKSIVNVKTEISENDEIDLDNFSVDHTLDQDKENDDLRNIGKQTECETEQNYESIVNVKSEISENNEIDCESSNNNDTLIFDKETKHCGKHTFFVDTSLNMDTRINKSTTQPEDVVLVKKEQNDNIVESFNQENDKILSKRMKLQDKLVFEKDTIIGEELKNSKKIPNRKPNVSKMELNNVNCEESTTICEKLSICKKIPKEKASANSELKHCDQNNLLVEREPKCNSKPYSCMICGFRCKLKISLSVHKKMHKDEKKFSCTVCDYKCNKKTILTAHMFKHTNQKQFKCELCPSLFKFKGNLSRHMREHTCKNPFRCQICDYTTMRKEHLLHHTRTHTGEKPFACQFCPNKYSSKMSLKKHVLCTHKDALRMYLNEDDQPLKRYEIERKTLETNLSKENIYRCGICMSEFKKSIHLEHHLKTHSDKKPFKCVICGQKFSQKGRLNTHMLAHKNERSYACAHCEYHGTDNHDLKRHMRVHTGEKPYACTYCDCRFSKSYTLSTHLRTHTGEKPFSCNICHYKCTRTSQLVRHMRTHTGEKPFSCDLCDFKCARHCYLLEHARKHTGLMLSCDYCSYKTTHKSCLVVHIKRHMELMENGRTRKPRARKAVASPELATS